MTNSASPTNKQQRRFQNLALLTVITIYLLILAGGVVRSTGSGMGCPDWPKCFGRWIPPTQLAQLPLNYQEIYGAKLKGEVVFNPVKTWIEYVNRLLGALSGLFVVATLVTSLPFWKKDKRLVAGSFLAFLFVGANGWLGSRVVATELVQYLITLHFLLAILVVFALLFVVVRAKSNEPLTAFQGPQPRLKWLLIAGLVLTVGQILLGTQVRTALDTVIRQLGYEQRDNWIGQLNWTFYVHRSFSLVVLGVHVAIIYMLRKTANTNGISWIANSLLLLIVLEILTGVTMAYFGVPAVAQPIHLVLAVLIVGLQYVVLLMIVPTTALNQMDGEPNKLHSFKMT